MPNNKSTTAVRYHDISCGHRVVGHENKCRHLHGHNYRVTFTVQMEGENTTDGIGRVMDFSVIKEKLCMWLEEHWDHKMLLWKNDPIRNFIDPQIETHVSLKTAADIVHDSIVYVSFNPTAENMAQHLVEVVGPFQLQGTGVRLVKCSVEETRKCSAEYSISD